MLQNNFFTFKIFNLQQLYFLSSSLKLLKSYKYTITVYWVSKNFSFLTACQLTLFY